MTAARDEATAVTDRYARRDAAVDAARYSIFNGAALHALQQRQRVTLQMLGEQGVADLAPLHILDLGCGTGSQLLDLIRWGAKPAQLTGIDLLPERIQTARERCPEAVRLLCGDALQANVAEASQDLVMQFTVFSSILDDAVQAALAQRAWHWIKPGGALLWYDFTVDNPRNPDVRGVPVQRVRELFPAARSFQTRRVTLAPPIARRLPGWLRHALDWPPLRTHVLMLICKPESTRP